ncbi:MAG: TerB family tellurite resistance protein [Myxococcota bacterium]
MTEAGRDPELLEAIAAAYAYVGSADNLLADVEVERLKEWGLTRGFSTEEAEVLDRKCRVFSQTLVDDNWGEAADKLLARVGMIAAGKRAVIVLAAARVAVVADGDLDEREEAALVHVAAALGVDPDEA